MKHKQQSKVLTIDSAFEEALEKYIDLVIERKKGEYASPLEPFDVYAQKVRRELSDHFHNFREQFMSGYHVLMCEMKKNRPKF